MNRKQQPPANPIPKPAAGPQYDSKPLAIALNALSRVEIDSMLANIASLETQIAKLNISGHEDTMMHMVTDGLNRLTYFLDAVRKYKDESGEAEQLIAPDST